MNLFGADCSSIPADWIKNTKGEADPSIMGTSAAVKSTYTLSMPKPHNADIKCSTVCTLTPRYSRQEERRVSTTKNGSALMSTTGLRSIRLNTTPVFGAAGRSMSATVFPVCKPIPVALTKFFKVRWRIIVSKSIHANKKIVRDPN